MINKSKMDKIIQWPAHLEKFESIPHHVGEDVDSDFRFRLIQDLVNDAEVRIEKLPKQDAYILFGAKGGILNNAASNIVGRAIYGDVVIIPLVTLKKWGLK